MKLINGIAIGIVLMVFTLSLSLLFAYQQNIDIKKIDAQKIPHIESAKQFSNEIFNFYNEEDGELDKQKIVYFAALAILSVLFIIVLIFIIKVVRSK